MGKSDTKFSDNTVLEPRDYSLLQGSGGHFSFEINDAIDIPTSCDSLSLFRLGVSWGGGDLSKAIAGA